MAIDTKKQKFRRTHYLVARTFQLKYVGLILLLMFLTAALCSYIVYYTSMIVFGEKLANVYPQGRLVSIVRLVNFRILLSILLVTPLVAVIGIFLSHRIAGPIFRMEKFLNGIVEGNLGSRLVLRKGDELITLADGINRLVESLKATFANQNSRLNKIKEELKGLKETVASKPQDTAGISKRIDVLEGELKNLSKEIDKYKV